MDLNLIKENNTWRNVLFWYWYLFWNILIENKMATLALFLFRRQKFNQQQQENKIKNN